MKPSDPISHWMLTSIASDWTVQCLSLYQTSSHWLVRGNTGLLLVCEMSAIIQHNNFHHCVTSQSVKRSSSVLMNGSDRGTKVVVTGGAGTGDCRLEILSVLN